MEVHFLFILQMKILQRRGGHGQREEIRGICTTWSPELSVLINSKQGNEGTEKSKIESK